MIEKCGSRLLASKAQAREFDRSGRVKFVHKDLPNGSIWVESGYHPNGIAYGEHLDIWYDWTPTRGYYVARFQRRNHLRSE